MKVSYFLKANSIELTPEKNIELDEILGAIKNGKYQNQILALRKLTDEKQIKNAKINLPNFTASGVFTECKDNCLVNHSGFIQVDIDLKDILKAGLTKDELRKKLLADNYIYSLFDSPTNTGLKALVKLPTIDHLGSFLALENYFLEKYKVQIDRSCKNISRRFFVSYDKDLYLNKDSEIFAEIAHEEKEFKEFSKEIDKEIFREAVNHIPGKSKDDGKRSYYLNIIWACKTVLGESEAFSIGEKLLSSSDMIKDLPSIIRTGKTILHPQLVFKEAISAGWIYPKKAKSKVVNINSKRNSTEGNLAVNEDPKNDTVQDAANNPKNSTLEKIRTWLNSKYDFKYNEITNSLLYSQKNMNVFSNVDKLVVNDWIQEMDKLRIKSNKDNIDIILVSSFSKKSNPIKEYFESLNIENIDAINNHYMQDFYTLITGKSHVDNTNEFETMKTWFAITAGLSICNDVNNLYCLCFYSGQGTGKTSLMSRIIPTPLKEYSKDNFNDYESKDAKFALAENFLIQVDELGQSSKHDLLKLKSLITQKSVKERKQFATLDTVMQRRASFIATFDNDKVFSDTAGNRRFIVIEVVKIDFEKLTDDFINGLWSESKWFYLNNAYNKYIDNINSNNNEKFEKSNVALDSILSLYDVEIKEPTTYFMTNEITAKINTHFKTNLTSNAVGEALKKLGFKAVAKKINGVSRYRYCIQEKTPQQLLENWKSDKDEK